MAGRVTVRERRLALEGRDARVVGEVTDSIRDAVGERIILRVDFGHARSRLQAKGRSTWRISDGASIGSVRIEAHDTPVDDFPQQSSQKDGLRRMCAIHWNASRPAWPAMPKPARPRQRPKRTRRPTPTRRRRRSEDATARHPFLPMLRESRTRGWTILGTSRGPDSRPGP